MLFDGFSLHAVPTIMDAACKNCGNNLEEVSSGLISKAMYCPNCEAVYMLKLVKVRSSKVSKAFLEQCRKEVSSRRKK